MKERWTHDWLQGRCDGEEKERGNSDCYSHRGVYMVELTRPQILIVLRQIKKSILSFKKYLQS